MSGRRRPTMKDVARHAGVSVSTVSYVLNDSGPVAPDRRNRVLDAIRVLEYSPNESARNLKRRSASTIGMVVPELANQFFAMVTEGVQRAASSRDVLVVLVVPDAGHQPEEDQTRLLRSQRVDGVVYLSGTGTAPAPLYELARTGPVVLVDEQLPGLELPTIVCDSRRGAREVAAHVLEQGHRRLAVIGGPPALWTSQQRLAGYREAFAGAGIDPDQVVVLNGDYRQASGSKLARKALCETGGPRPTALLCANDLMAIGAVEACRDVGLRVPEDVSIVGFDDLPFSSLLTPSLTSVRQPAHDMGFQAGTVLLDTLEGRPVGPISPLPVSVELRDSVCPPEEET
ncbi:LacI family transcriptional regulator [Pseudonocardia autotrophica]|uniref:HTH-type transcriptional repressor CytR n=2 Tax=Pseudonocardia TaxID=1847 RepID=A0A1Y2MNY1_PSEAH|nr:LacI family DNA-binding transcriptional regulator [Pseudonocardia autotrophica]OSY36882.1 HTH-type transcriptional repressor CytR [Pseudonocardia autotrophica]TDN76872.1 LacI family transcriptional regulator [Pseudonocardia autotrophica]